jgi:hypothetical protein
MSPCEYMLMLKFNQQGTCGQTWDGIPIKNLKMKFQLWGGSFYNLNMNGNFYNFTYVFMSLGSIFYLFCVMNIMSKKWKVQVISCMACPS